MRTVKFIGSEKAVKYAKELVEKRIASHNIVKHRYSVEETSPVAEIQDKEEDAAVIKAARVKTEVQWVMPKPRPQIEMINAAPLAIPAETEEDKAAAANEIAVTCLAISRVVSNRTFAQLLHHASWCLLKDRISLMNAVKTAISTFCNMRKMPQLSFGVRSKSWAHFTVTGEAPAEEDGAALNWDDIMLGDGEGAGKCGNNRCECGCHCPRPGAHFPRGSSVPIPPHANSFGVLAETISIDNGEVQGVTDVEEINPDDPASLALAGVINTTSSWRDRRLTQFDDWRDCRRQRNSRHDGIRSVDQRGRKRPKRVLFRCTRG